jgi:hypothetical protein
MRYRGLALVLLATVLAPVAQADEGEGRVAIERMQKALEARQAGQGGQLDFGDGSMGTCNLQAGSLTSNGAAATSPGGRTGAPSYNLPEGTTGWTVPCWRPSDAN